MLKNRTTEAEFTEQRDCDPELAQRAYRGMAVFNRKLGGIQVACDFVAAQVAALPPGQPLRVLDIGSGSCDIPLAVSRWAWTQGLSVNFTCVERSEVAVRMAREAIKEAGDERVRVVQADIFTYQPDEPFDCAIGSMFFHHFTDEEILTLVRHLRGFVKNALLISDLLRYTPNYAVIWLLSLGLSTALRHDVRASVRRGFKLTELRHLLQKMDNVSVTVKRNRFFRALAIVKFNPPANEKPTLYP